ncbi:hypothetical protein L0337_20670, partial [candidate division KSB1 bacterium]|nr:hypothetical protein [candidate division KSB1 bacterium]
MLSYLIATIVLIAVLLWDFMDVFGFASHTTINYFIFMGILGSQIDKEKRSRLYTSLPVLQRTVPMMDLMYVGLCHAGMVILWIVFLIIGYDHISARTVWGLLSLNGFILSLIVMFIIHTHLGFFDTKLYKRSVYAGMLAVVAAMATLQYFGTFARLMGFLTRQLAMPSGAIALNVLALLLAYWSTVLFTRRKSYLA